MTREELRECNMEQNLCALMSLDPRGYGVCRILEDASKHQENPGLFAAARRMGEVLKKDSVLFIFTGFVLESHEAAETDGLIGSVLLAKAVIDCFGAKPVLICPKECVKAVRHCGRKLGYHVYRDLSKLQKRELSMGVAAFTKDWKKAEAQAKEIRNQLMPALMIAIEAAGANEKKIYHNAAGHDVTALEAKSEVLWELLQAEGVPSISIGDLGNELGMGTLKDQILRYVPRTGQGECTCGCGAGILAGTHADQVITGTCSDWGSYALIAAMAYLFNKPQILPDRVLYEEVLKEGVRSKLIDMTGSLLPGIDGFCLKLNAAVIELMGECINHGLAHRGEYEAWEDQVIEKSFFSV